MGLTVGKGFFHGAVRASMVQAFVDGITVISGPGIEPFLESPVVPDQTEVLVLHSDHAGSIVKP